VILSEKIAKHDSIFIDTAPFIYFIEAHKQFGPLTREIFTSINALKIKGITSVLTLTELLPKPISIGNNELAGIFSEYLRRGNNLELIEISADIAEEAGILRGRYQSLKTIDALQIAAAVHAKADIFLTNDKGLKKIEEIDIIILSDYHQNDV